MATEINIQDCVGSGIDGIEFTWNMQTALEKLGPCDEKKTFENKYTDSESVYLNYYQKGISLLFNDNILTSIFLYSGVPCGYEPGRFSCYQFQTSHNISFDTDAEQIKSILGNPKRENPNKFATVPYSTLSYTGLAFDVCLEDGKIGNIIILNQ